jgi:glycosyltransferase involved in cell wall biosynthesis
LVELELEVLMRISVALATYNGARFLSEQLRSIAAQTVRPDELVVSDDGSTDDTLRILAGFAEQAGFPVRIVPDHPRFGFADNFLHAAGACRHDLVAFADQDDVWMPNKLEIARTRMIRDDSLISLHWLTLTDEALRPNGVLQQGIQENKVYAPLQLEPYMTGWGNSMMFRRRLLNLIPPAQRPQQPGTERPSSHDTWLYTLAAALGRVSHIATPLLLYRQHGSNAAGFRHGTLWDRLREVSTVPVGAYRARILFNAAMEKLCHELSQTGPEDVKMQASMAAATFAKRRKRVSTRVALHTGRGLGARIAAFRLLVADSSAESEGARARRFSLAKDFALGVLRLGRQT